jgi:hypothetical protein
MEPPDVRVSHAIDGRHIGIARGDRRCAPQVSAGELDRREEPSPIGERGDGGAQQIRAAVRIALVDGTAPAAKVRESTRGV